MKKFYKVIAAAVCFLLLASSVIMCTPDNGTATEVQAASKKTVKKAKLWAKSRTRAVANPETIQIQNKKKGASYQFKSSNTKIVTVNKKGSYQGVKAGKAKITVTEVYKKKKTKVGDLSITIKNSTLSKSKIEAPLGKGGAFFVINNINPKAVYTFTPKDSSLLKVIKEKEKDTDPLYVIEGLQAGKTTVTVTEKYKNKTRNLGSVEVEIKLSYFPDEKYLNPNISVGDEYTLLDYLVNPNGDAEYKAKAADNTIVEVKIWDDDPWSLCIAGKKQGKTDVELTETYRGKTRTVGTFHVTVTQVETEAFYWNDSDTENIELTLLLSEEPDDYTVDLTQFFGIEPFDLPVPVEYSSGDPSIAGVTADGTVTGLKKGNTVITLKSGSYTLTAAIEVI